MKTEWAGSKNFVGIIRRTLGQVDKRLVEHGERVAFIVMKMMEEQGGYKAEEIRNTCLLALIHDIGAYKTEEIDNMVEFETKNVWNHAIYGYLYVKYLSPFHKNAPIILFHHMDYRYLEEKHLPQEKLIQMLHLADRLDIYYQEGGGSDEKNFLDKFGSAKFSLQILDLYRRTEEHHNLEACFSEENYLESVLECLEKKPFTSDEIDQLLAMIVFAIDFRSYFTVVHTMMTTGIGVLIARYLGLSGQEVQRIKYGAMLHDLGKIGIPVEILEFPGKLSPQAMKVMRTHVDITETIMGGEIETATALIALRHHEKLDGSGYPKGLKEADLTQSEKIVAVADIVSALSGRRSYKEAFHKETILKILKEEAACGRLYREAVAVMTGHYDEIIEAVEKQCRPVLDLYERIQEEYQQLLKEYGSYN